MTIDVNLVSELETQEQKDLSKFLKAQMGEPTHLLPKATIKTVVSLNTAIQALIDIEPIVEEHPFYYQGISSLTGILSDILHTMEKAQVEKADSNEV